MTSIAPETARRVFRGAEPIHGMIYFTPFGAEAYAALGFTHPRMGYFASRSAPMGAVAAEVTIATFFNFNPELVHAVLPEAWTIATPEQILTARLDAVDRSLRKAWGEHVDGTEVREAAELARRAAERACNRPQGRPLFGRHASLPWPEEPHLVLWHAQSLLREFRGDSHVALLHAEGLNGVEALVVHAATGDVPAAALQMSRAWDNDQWAEGVEGVRARGWLEDGPELHLNEVGRDRRKRVEHQTDVLGSYPYEAIGETGCSRLIEISERLSGEVIDADLGFPAALAARRRLRA
ncbi:SCO6745 family protein [Rhodococcus sp. 311R]|uniref:SCO6745 family protein n=1 Tax=Rhodococcus sp. 311R TaxID=1617904 RepID=UPI00067F3227|nr:hypothetical protein [Rhodococcus sp. 311R]